MSRRLVVIADGDEAEAEILAGDLTDRLSSAGIDLRIHQGVPATADEWASRLQDADGTLLGWSMPAGVMTRLPRLRVVSFAGTGASDHLDLDEADRCGVAVTTVSGYGDNAVAEHAVALMLASLRGIPQADAAMRRGEWPAVPAAREARGLRVGIVGFGGIGRRMAELCTALGMRVQVWAREGGAGVLRAGDSGLPVVTLDQLFASSDVVSLHVALTPETDGLVDGRLLALVPPGALLVNTSRGAVVDETALQDALRTGPLAGAALDVFSTEPLPAGSGLRSSSRIVLTPHVAYNTEAASRELISRAVDNLIDALGTGAPPA